MLVLKIIGVLVGLFLLAMFVSGMNDYTQKKYRYEIFNWYNLAAAGVGYGLMLFGRNWYLEALSNRGDTLNGMILFAIGVLIIFMVVFGSATSFVYSGFYCCCLWIVDGSCFFCANETGVFY